MVPNLYGWALGAAATAAIGAAAWNFTPWVGPHAVIGDLREDVATLTVERDKAIEVAEGWKAGFDEAEALRAEERQEAVAAVDDAARRCDARVAEARRSAAAIRDLLEEEPERDSEGCPVRELVPADRLRDALQPPAG